MTNVQDDFRRRFHDLTDQVNAIREKSAPLRKERDDNIDDLTPNQVKEMNAQIRKIEEPLFDMENERGMMVRALNGKTGVRQEDGSIVMPVKEDAAVEEAVAESAEEEA